MHAAVRFGVLGPLELAVDGRPVALGSPSQRALLSVLLARAGEHVPADTLADVLWGDTPPRTASHTLRAYVSRLRRLVGERLVTSAGGYVLLMGDGELDAHRFLATLSAARGGRAGVPELEAALGCWRGAAFAGTADLAPVRARARELDEARRSARELLGRGYVRTGRAADAVALAEGLTTERPLDEGGWVLLLEALGAAGRIAEALAAYRRAHEALREEGLIPSPTSAKPKPPSSTHPPPPPPPRRSPPPRRPPPPRR